MILILSEISLEDLIKKADMKEYAYSCDYFSLIFLNSKNEAAEQAEGWVTWYSLFSTVPLYVSVITNRYWFSVCGNLDRTVRFTTWKTVPHYLEEANKEDSPFHAVKDSNKICSRKDIEELCESIKKHNYKDKPVFSIKIG